MLDRWIVESLLLSLQDWIPASAGMTGRSGRESDGVFGNHYSWAYRSYETTLLAPTTTSTTESISLPKMSMTLTAIR